MQRFENVIESDPSANCESIFYRVDMNVSEETQIDSDASSYGACRVGVSVAASCCQEGNALLTRVFNLQEKGSAMS